MALSMLKGAANRHNSQDEANSDTPQTEKEKELAEWLKRHDLEAYTPAFLKEHIDIASLPQLDEFHLKELGLSVGHRIKLKNAIQETLLPRNPSIEERGLSILESDMEYVCKVIVVGESGTGKTSLIQRYTNGTFDKTYKATIGVDFCLKEIKWNNNTTVSVRLWDIAGQERFANLTRMYYKEARGAFVVFDVTKPRTYEAVVKWKSDIDAKVTLPNGKVIPVVLLANKCDLLDKQAIENLDGFCKDHGFEKWFLTSAKEDIGIEEAARFLVQTILDNDEIYAQYSVHDFPGLNLGNTATVSKTSGCCT